MQNTNTNPVSNTVSSLQKEKAAAKASAPVAVRSTVREPGETGLHETVLRKIKKFLLGLFFRRTRKPQKADSRILFAAAAEQKRTAHKDEQAKISVGAVVSIQSAMAPSPAAMDTLRKIAEQQFITMDTSQATRN